MNSSGDIIDKKHLYSSGSCSCSARTTTYEQRLRLRRACIAASAMSPYVVQSVTVDASGQDYLEGDYVQISVGSPELLVQVTGIDVDGGVLAVTPLNAPMIQSVPVNPLSSTGGTGSGATFTVTVVPNPAICCTCNGIPAQPIIPSQPI